MLRNLFVEILVCVSVNLGIETKLLVVAPKPFELSGTADVRVGLPWPLPDFKFSGSFIIGKEVGWPDDYPHADYTIQDISLFPRSNGTAVNEEGESYDGVVLSEQVTQATSGIPVDAGILIAFRAPVGNEQPKIGLVSTQSDDMADKVWEIATTGTNKDNQVEKLGWRHVLNRVSLWEVATPNTEVATHGGWSYRGVDGTTEHSVNEGLGGQALRTSLTLFAPFEAIEQRRFGTGAKVLGEIIEGWQPCEQSPNPKDYKVVFVIPAPSDLGIDTNARRLPFISPGQRGTLKRYSIVPGAKATVLYSGPHNGASSFFPPHSFLPPGAFERPSPLSFRLPIALASQEFIITLPAMVFARQPDVEAAKVLSRSLEPPAGRLEIRIPNEGSSRFAYFAVRHGADIQLFDHFNQLHEGEVPPQGGTIYISEDEVWELRRISLGEEITVLLAHVVQAQVLTSGLMGQYGAVFLGASYYAEHETREASINRRREASVQLVAEVGAQASDWASGGYEGLLKPDTEYALEVEVWSNKVKQIGDGVLDIAGITKKQIKLVRFKTEEDIVQPLAPHLPGPTWAGEVEQNWNIKTKPAREAFHYRADDIEVQMADAVVEGRISAHGRSVSLRLTHASGSTPEIRAEELVAEQKKNISELQEIISEYVFGSDTKEGWPCLDEGNPLWLTLTRHYKTLLLPGPYVAELMAEDSNGTTRDPVLLHRWRFNASRWVNLKDHVEAYKPDDDWQPVPRPGLAGEVLSAAKSRLGATVSEILTDDLLLDALLTEDFGEPPSLPSIEPIVHLWVREDGVAGLMLDGPEPLIVDGITVKLAGTGNIALHSVISNVFGSRILLVPQTIIPIGSIHLQMVAEGDIYKIELKVPLFSDLTEGVRA